MIDQSTFEIALERRLTARAARADRSFDASMIASAAIDAAPRRPGPFSVRVAAVPMLGWLVLIGLLVVVLAGVIAGTVAPPPAEPVVLAIGRSDGFRIQTLGSTAEPRIGNGPYFQPRWSADGTFVAVTALTDVDLNHLLVYRVNGSIVEASLATDVVGVTSEIEWSPTGHEVAVQSMGSNAISVINADDATVRTLVMPDGLENAATFSWSPDGQRIIVAANPSEDGALGPAWILDPTDVESPVPFGTGDAAGLRGPRWSPDGSRVAAVERCPNGDCIRIRDTESGQRRSEIMSLTSPSRLAWSPDGAWLAFDSGGDLEIASADAETVTPLTAGLSRDLLVEWAPDGRSVVIWRVVTPGGQEPYEFWSVPIDGSAPTLLVRDAYGVSMQPTTP